MDSYRAMYVLLFNAVTDALSFLSDGETERAVQKLCRAQQACEELYISAKSDDCRTVLR